MKTKQITFLLGIFLVLITSCTFKRALLAGEKYSSVNIDLYAIRPEVIEIKSVNITYYGWLLKQPKNEGKPLILYFYGSGSNLNHSYNDLLAFYKAGFNVLSFEYPGNGVAEGNVSLKNAVEMSKTLVREITKKYSNEKIVIVGFSIGGYIALGAAEVNSKFPLILINPVTSANDFIKLHLISTGLPGFLINLFGENFSSYELVQKLKNDKIFIISEADNQIGISNSKNLYDKARENRRVYIIPGGHNIDFNSPELQSILKKAIFNKE